MLLCTFEIKLFFSYSLFSPFWAEETTFDVPREFHQLSFYIHEKDWLKRSDSVVKKVALRRDELPRYHGKDQWFPLQAVDSDSEVHVSIAVVVIFQGHHTHSSTCTNFGLYVFVC